MSKIHKLFKGGGGSGYSKGKGKGGPTPQEALARLRETEEMLTKKQEYLEARIEKELVVAKKHGTRDKRDVDARDAGLTTLLERNISVN
ncbi:UNVERIFIED_CONTAM: hypothetical protein K2H54_037613 [Gekko kuhli]